MTNQEITSLKNPLVKQMRKLHRAKERREQNLFLLEGTHLIEVACEVGFSLSTVFCTPEWTNSHPDLWERASRGAERAVMVSPEVLSAIATTVNPNGVVATAYRPAREGLNMKGLELGLAIDRLQDPGNMGTIIRTAAATNVDGVWVSGDSVDLDNPKVLRASAGAWFRLPMAVSEDLREVVTSYRSQGVQVVATLPQAALTYWDVDYTRPTLILLGNEGAGLSEDLVQLSDLQVQIPVGENVESLNVAIASALLLYEAQRQKSVTSYQ